MQIDTDAPIFTVPESASLAKMLQGTANLWLRQEGYLGYHTDQFRDGPGGLNRICLRTVFALCIASRLRSLGALPAIACKAAAAFAYGDEYMNATAKEQPSGSTMLAVSPAGDVRVIYANKLKLDGEEFDGCYIVPYARMLNSVLALYLQKTMRGL